MIDEMRKQVYYSDTIPAFSSLVASADGDLWIGSFIPPERQMFDEPWPSQEWLVLDAAGEGVARVTTPAGLRVTQVGTDFVLGIHTDDLGVETVRRFPLRR